MPLTGYLGRRHSTEGIIPIKKKERERERERKLDTESKKYGAESMLFTNAKETGLHTRGSHACVV